MSLTGSVMLIHCDFDGDPAEHDDWHTHEHLHERLSIPGFRRGTRWARAAGSPRYMMVYEVDGLDVAGSQAYLARLNDPSKWTASIMPRVLRMKRGFCNVKAGAGYGLGGFALSIPLSLSPGSEAQVLDPLTQRLPALASARGVASVHLLEPGPRPPMTKEQSLRGQDTGLGWVLLATGYDAGALESLMKAPGLPHADGAGIFTLQHTVTAEDARLRGRPPAPA